MAKKVLSLPFLPLPLLLLLFFFASGGILKLANGQMKTWCVAKPSSSEAELAANIDFACNQIQNCNIIQEGGPCYYPNTAINHASVVMNLYYQLNGRNNWNCDYRASGLTTLSDPKYIRCCNLYLTPFYYYLFLLNCENFHRKLYLYTDTMNLV
ncbi:X8 domain-containing protein [Citrus sinensis]|nr:X8 domain-containing protein [Citrus sinensis]